jgi:hypothetical protein
LRGCSGGAAPAFGEHARHEVRLECEVTARHLTIVERRAPWCEEVGPEWTSLPIARLRYTKATTTWILYWRDRNLRFHAYAPLAPSAHLETLLRHLLMLRGAPRRLRTRMTEKTSKPKPAPAPLAVGARVRLRRNAEPVSGVVIEDFAELTETDERGHDWAPVHRWAIALDDGRLAFVDTNDLEVESAATNPETGSTD